MNLSPLANWVLAFGLTAMLAVVIAFLTLLQPQSAPGPAGVDKVHHFITFAGLMLPVATLRPRALVWMIPAALLFGAGIEIIQPFVNRSRDLADFLADSVGVLAGSALGLAIFWLRATAKTCLIPRFDGAILSQKWKEAVWDKFVMGAPRPRTPSELQYSDRKLRSRS